MIVKIAVDKKTFNLVMEKWQPTFFFAKILFKGGGVLDVLLKTIFHFCDIHNFVCIFQCACVCVCVCASISFNHNFNNNNYLLERFRIRNFEVSSNVCLCQDLVLDQPVDVVLSPVFRCGHLKNKSYAQKGLLSITVGYHL